ncbi:hypothetical protein DQ04_19551000 [Trypanosoma grayi]|uniref:hypothetical protein n=1 Tax=Trypanosoma grayi TaxID=71804 RepID=UPI0004F42C6A|nr:hypothetical protein DQ04_19551000 [Trypanosoma grayi]KEG05661.1 hypothetical protein DQ04_19551000 [Trypanosoma grayi]
MTVTVRHVLFVLSLALCCACGCVAAVQQDQVLSDIDVPAEYTNEKIRSEAVEGMQMIEEALKKAQDASAEAARLYTMVSDSIEAAEAKGSSSGGGVAGSFEAAKAKDVLYPAHSAKRTVDREFKLLQEINTNAQLAHDWALANLTEGDAKRGEAFLEMMTVQVYELAAIGRVNTLLQHAKIVVDASVGALGRLYITNAAKPLPAEMVPRVPKPPADVPGVAELPNVDIGDCSEQQSGGGHPETEPSGGGAEAGAGAEGTGTTGTTGGTAGGSADLAGRDGSGPHMWVRASLFLVVAAYAVV